MKRKTDVAKISKTFKMYSQNIFREKQQHQLNVEQAKVKKSILLAAESTSAQ